MTATTSRILAAIFLIAGVFLACTDDDPTGPEPAGKPWLLQAVYPVDLDHPLHGTVGAPLDSLLRFRVLDREGRSVPRARVTFVVLDTGQAVGTLDPTETRSDGAGIASTRWILGTKAGELQQIEALLEVQDTSDEPLIRRIIVSAIGKPDVPAKLEIVAGDGQVAPTNDTLGGPLAIRVRDRYGNPVPDVTVTWQSDGDGMAIPAQSATDTAGIARTRVVTGSESRTQITTAKVSGLPEVRFSTTVVDRSDLHPAAIAPYGWPPSVRARVGEMSPKAPAVRVVDPNGYPVQGVRVDWVIEAGQGELRQSYSFTNSDGIATNLWRFGTKAGKQVLRASILGGQVDTTLIAEAIPGAPTSLHLVSGDNQTGTVARALPLPFRVRVDDVYGNAIPGIAVHWGVATLGVGGTFSPSVSVTDQEGIASATFTPGTQAGDYLAEARLEDEHGTVSPVRFRVEAKPGPVAKLSRIAGDGQFGLPGDTLLQRLAVRVTDAYDNPVAAARVTWRVNAGSGTLAQVDTITDADGFARARYTAGTEKMQTVEASSDTAKTEFQVFGFTPAIVVVSGDQQTGNVNVTLGSPLVVRVTDATTDQPVPGVRVVWAVDQGGGSVSPTESVTDESGRASTTRTLGPKVGTHTTIASVGSSTAVFHATAVGARGEARIEKISGDGQTGVAGKPLLASYVVRVLDRFGVPVSGVQVRWRVADGDGGSISSPTSTTDGQGLAQVIATLPGVVGETQRVIAQVDALSDSVVFASTAVTSSEPYRVVRVSGDDQVGVAGWPLAEPLVVRVTTESGEPVAGVTVHWAVGQGGGTVSQSTSVTAVDGTASVERTLGDVIGLQTTTASVPNLEGSPVTFRHQAAAPSTPYLIEKAPGENGDGQFGVAGQPLPKPLRVIVLNANRAPVPGVTVVWRAETGGGFVGGDGYTLATSVTDGSGIATMVRTLGPASGPQTTTAEVSGLAGSPVIFTAEATPPRAPAFIEVLAETDEQFGIRNQILLDSVRVVVLDEARVPMSGIPVHWRVISGGGTVGSPFSVTDAQGIAPNTFRLGSILGRVHAVEVSADGLAVRDTLWATATPEPAKLLIYSGDNQVARSDGMLAPLRVLVLDAMDQPVRGAAVVWHIGGGDGMIGGSPLGPWGAEPVVTLTDANGIATAWRRAPVAAPGSNEPVVTIATLRDFSTVPAVTFIANWQ